MRQQTHFDAAWALYQRYYEEVNGEHAHVYPGVREGLDALQARGWKLACLTNKPVAAARELLQRKQLDGYFAHVFGGDSFDATQARSAAAAQNLRSAGHAAGAHADDRRLEQRRAGRQGRRLPGRLVSYGYNHGEPMHRVDADGVVDSIAQLAQA